MNLVLRPYVEQFSAKSHDWQNYIKFLFIPLGTYHQFFLIILISRSKMSISRAFFFWRSNFESISCLLIQMVDLNKAEIKRQHGEITGKVN